MRNKNDYIKAAVDKLDVSGYVVNKNYKHNLIGPVDSINGSKYPAYCVECCLLNGNFITVYVEEWEITKTITDTNECTSVW